MMKTILQKIRVELAILGKKKDNLSPVFPRLDTQMSKVLRCVKRTVTDCFSFFLRKRCAVRQYFLQQYVQFTVRIMHNIQFFIKMSATSSHDIT